MVSILEIYSNRHIYPAAQRVLNQTEFDDGNSG